jgi:RES domain-containing protein
LYAATHLSLALLEQLVHVNPERLPDAFRAVAIALPDDAPTEIVTSAPDAGDQTACRPYGDIWAGALRSAALIVPSVWIPATLEPGGIGSDERNAVLNPRHPSAAVWRVVEMTFQVDMRLKRAVAG